MLKIIGAYGSLPFVGGSCFKLERKLTSPQRREWGAGRVAFLRLRSEISKALVEGRSVSSIYTTHKQELGISYPQFAAYVRRYCKGRHPSSFSDAQPMRPSLGLQTSELTVSLPEENQQQVEDPTDLDKFAGRRVDLEHLAKLARKAREGKKNG